MRDRDKHRRVPRPPFEDRSAAKSPRSPYGEVQAKMPRTAASNAAAMQPLWSLRILDLGGPWCSGAMGGNTLVDVLRRLKAFETMTWREIEGKGSHFVDVSGCCKKARDRLVELRHDDADSLFSLRFGGKPRLYGVRDENVLAILWWDPDHEIY